MISCVRVKDGVEFTKIAPAGFHILAAIDSAAAFIAHDLTITSACDGEHSGPDDPHKRGEAFDVRSHDLPDKQLALQAIMNSLGTLKFYGFIEDETEANEHLHVQLRHGIIYP